MFTFHHRLHRLEKLIILIRVICGEKILRKSGEWKIFIKVVSKYNFYYLCIMKKIIAYKNYFNDFLHELSEQERKKFLRALDLLMTEEKIPHHYIKYIRDGIYEFRTNYGNNEFRVFFIYDGNTVVVLFNAFRKKTQKTPENEIKKAIRLKEEYYETKGDKQRNL